MSQQPSPLLDPPIYVPLLKLHIHPGTFVSMHTADLHIFLAQSSTEKAF